MTDTAMTRDLHADCASCFGLCCVATTLTRSADFAIDKPAGVPCLHLAEDSTGFGCTIHDRLRSSGFPGCTTYDCFGAGQHVAQHTFGGTHWREAPETAEAMFAVLGVVRALHELLWHLEQAAALPSSAALVGALVEAVRATEEVADGPPDALVALDVAAHRSRVLPLLRRAGELARAGTDVPGEVLDGADLSGRDLRARRLRGASLRGALLIGSDLRGADLSLADLTGADLRAADVRGADLTEALFLSPVQIAATRSDGTTRLPVRSPRARG